MTALLSSLTEAELSLLRETEQARLAELEEDALVELHTRIRRARNKHVKVYRRQAAALVGEVGGRGKARPKNTRKRAKAEVFEEALATVSQHLAAAARVSAEALRAERVAEDRQEQRAPSPPRSKSRPGTVLGPQRTDRRPDSPDLRKRHASTRATGARRQARRDSR
ncbi:hypothetical protein AB0C29_06095 [Actinoplanes sp. NPDC048791]|uniref:hypothetical protein n=1 Tax=Actinoplanes sp. NPDC048791 TaxID=3154623 RepID=UPI0033DAF78B